VLGLSATDKDVVKNNGVYQYTNTETVDKSMSRGQWIKDMTDVITPNYKHLRDTGVIVNNPYSRTVRALESRECFITADAEWTNSGSGYEYSYELGGTLHPYQLGIGSNDESGIAPKKGILAFQYAPFEPWISDLEHTQYVREAVSEVYAKTADAPLNAWVIVGEFNETINTIVWIFRKIRLLHDLLRKGKSSAAGRELNKRLRSGKVLQWEDFEELSNAYLQVRYGIRPLVYDLMGALEALRELGEGTRQRFGIKTEDSILYNDVSDYSFQIRDFTSAAPTLANRYSKCHKLAVRAGLLALPVFEEANILTVIGTGEIVKGLWDLVPYSFVIDWFLTTSDLLTSWSPNALVRVLASWAVCDETQSITAEVLTEGHGFAATRSDSSLSESRIITLSGRVSDSVILTQRIPNPPRAIMPSLKLRLDMLKGVDMLALANQIGKFRPRF
jgi:hypothetical protein